MTDLNWLAVAGGTVSAFLLGGVYYSVLGNTVAELTGTTSETGAGAVVVEIVRCLILALAVGLLASAVGADTWVTGLLLGLGLWVAFPAVLWVGAVVHEHAAPLLALIHAGDWLVKLAMLGILFGATGNR